jgi:hypothetical protein
MILYRKVIEDGREATIYLQIFGTVRLVVGPRGDTTVDDGW